MLLLGKMMKRVQQSDTTINLLSLLISEPQLSQDCIRGIMQLICQTRPVRQSQSQKSAGELNTFLVMLADPALHTSISLTRLPDVIGFAVMHIVRPPWRNLLRLMGLLFLLAILTVILNGRFLI